LAAYSLTPGNILAIIGRNTLVLEPSRV